MGADLQILEKKNYLRMPWKNGLGVTEEIAIHPPKSDFSEGNFTWRLSAATIAAEGAFSIFPGCDRWLTVWKGRGISLNGDYLPRGEVRRFAGEIPVMGVPDGAPLADLGLIFRRDLVAETHMRVLERPSGVFSPAVGAGTHFFFCAEGSVGCAAGRLETGDCLWLENAAELEFQAEGSFVLIHITMEWTRPLPLAEYQMAVLDCFYEEQTTKEGKVRNGNYNGRN